MDTSHNILSEWFTANEMLYQLIFDFRISFIKEVISEYYIIVFVISLGFIIHFIPEKLKIWYRKKFAQSNFFLQLAVCFLVIFVIYQIASTSLQPFIYFQF